MKRFVLPLALSLVAPACTSTQTHIASVRQAKTPLRLSGARVVVLPFRGAPGQPETGPSVRELMTRALAEQRHAVVTSPSLVESYLKEHAVVPSEEDRGPLEVLGEALGAEVIVWGSVNQFTPYRFDRLAPATPPYIELTVRALRVGTPGVATVTARKQGSLPATIWSRQPTFDDVATEAIRGLLPTLP